MAITITFANPEGFDNKEFATASEVLNTLSTLEEKDVYINHAPMALEQITEAILLDASHIMIQDKLIGA